MKLRFRYFLVFIVFMVKPEFCSAEEIATIYSVEGVVEALTAPSQDWRSVEIGQKFQVNDSIRTKAKSRAAVRFTDGYLIRLNENSTITLKTNANQPQIQQVILDRGVGFFFSHKKQNFPQINTPHVSASVRGTEFVVAVENEKTRISVLDGSVVATNLKGSVQLAKGEEATAASGQAPVKQIIIQPIDAVQWALSYASVLDPADYAGAKSAGILLNQAEELLARGQVTQAQAILTQVGQNIKSSPANSQAALNAAYNAQLATIAVTKNQKELARELANKALAAKSDSASATLVMALVEQASFDLEGAISWLEKTIKLHPQSFFARTRLAELLLGFDQTDQALEILRKILNEAPDYSYAQAVLGFAELTNYQTESAIFAFNKALAKNGNQALAHLGLGLAKIRSGDLAQGRVELELAAHLEPNVSLYRSYLGKAYYEEEDYKLASREYQRANMLDPNDPTPYLYNSFLNLSMHRPIQALEDIQQSIDRNDNRAVYRSRLLLDQDQGTRSSGLGQVFNRLGFTELARNEAIKSLQHDYSNYSAHFLLADAYQDTHLNSRAQTTENLLGRLLVPVNFNSNNLSIGGSASLNEYTTLFDRPAERSNFEFSGNSEEKRSDWLAQHISANNNLGLNIGYSGGYQDGFRQNDWFRNHQLFMLGQYQVSIKDTLVWDAAVSMQDNGDTIVGYDPYQEDKDVDHRLDSYLGRVGYHKQLGPGSHLLGQVVYNFGKFDQFDQNNQSRISFVDVKEKGESITGEPFPFNGNTLEDLNTDQHYLRGDLQYIFDTELFSAVAGVSSRYEKLESKEKASVTDSGDQVLTFLDGFIFSSDATIEQHSERAFLYSTWHLAKWVDLDAGLTYAEVTLSNNAFDPPFVDNTFTQKDWSPKAGLTFYPTSTTTIRTSFAKTLDRTGRGELGPLEPTFVGGFNQVFDGVAGSEQTLWGIGIDQKLSNRAFVGLNYQRREIDSMLPVIRGGLEIDRNGLNTIQSFNAEVDQGSADVDSIRGYYYQILNNRFSTTLDYAWELFDDLQPFPDTETIRLAPKLNYFHPSGLFSFGQAVLRYQERGGDQDKKNKDDFWTINAGVGYQFNKRHGAVSLELTNILDQDFKYSHIQDEKSVRPEIGAELKVALNF